MIDFQVNHELEALEHFFSTYVSLHFSATDAATLLSCVALIKRSHAGQVRSDGVAYVTHPLRVALLIGLYECHDRDVLLAALLHDTLEDTDLLPEEIQNLYGEYVLDLVLAVTNPTSVYTDADHRRNEKTRKWEKTMQAPQNVRVIKTFDGLDNLIALKFIPLDQPHYQKIPRWLMQAKEMKLPLAKITNQAAYDLMLQEISDYEKHGFVAGDWSSDHVF